MCPGSPDAEGLDFSSHMGTLRRGVLLEAQAEWAFTC